MALTTLGKLGLGKKKEKPAEPQAAEPESEGSPVDPPSPGDPPSPIDPQGLVIKPEEDEAGVRGETAQESGSGGGV